jgi:hypothetical protein
MAYHNMSNTQQSTVNAQGQSAPAGYHYMPDGTLMLDTEHSFISDKVIRSFDLDLSDVPTAGETRYFSIKGDSGAQFRLEIKNEDAYYYDFCNDTFSSTVNCLEGTITNGSYNDSIIFPVKTTIGAYSNIDARNDKVTGTVNGDVIHAPQIVTLDQTVESLGINVGDRVTGNAALDGAIHYVKTLPTPTNGYTAYQFEKSGPTLISILDGTVLSFYSRQYEIYLYAVTGTSHTPYREVRFDDGSLDINSSSGSSSLLMRKVIYQYDTLGLTISGISLNSTISGVNTDDTISINRGKSSVRIPFEYVFTADATSNYAVRVLRQPALSDVLTYIEPTIGAAAVPIPGEDVSASAYRWPIDNYADKIKAGMIVFPGTSVTVNTTVADYYDTVTILECTEDEQVIVKTKVPAIDTKSQKPTIIKSLVTVQPGDITFDKQQVLALAGNTLKVGGYGINEISRVSGWDVRFTNLAIALTAPTTTTTATTTTPAIIVANTEGVINNVSRVGGIGINPALQNPLITAGGGGTGAGTWTTGTAAQTLENGITLTIENTGRVATITGNIEIIKAGTEDLTIYFDLEKLLSDTA